MTFAGTTNGAGLPGLVAKVRGAAGTNCDLLDLNSRATKATPSSVSNLGSEIHDTILEGSYSDAQTCTTIKPKGGKTNDDHSELLYQCD